MRRSQSHLRNFNYATLLTQNRYLPIIHAMLSSIVYGSKTGNKATPQMENDYIRIVLKDSGDYNQIAINLLIDIKAQNQVIINYLGALNFSLDRLEVDEVLRHENQVCKSSIIEGLIRDYDVEGVM